MVRQAHHERRSEDFEKALVARRATALQCEKAAIDPETSPSGTSPVAIPNALYPHGYNFGEKVGRSVPNCELSAGSYISKGIIY